MSIATAILDSVTHRIKADAYRAYVDASEDDSLDLLDVTVALSDADIDRVTDSITAFARDHGTLIEQALAIPTCRPFDVAATIASGDNLIPAVITGGSSYDSTIGDALAAAARAHGIWTGIPGRRVGDALVAQAALV